MSAASTPAPTRSAPPSRNNYFWPIFIYLMGALVLSFYQVESLEEQLGETTSAVDQLDAKVQVAQYEKAKFYALARDLIRLAPKHPAAETVVKETGLRNLAAKQPVLMSLDLPSGFTNAAPAAATKPAAEQPSTNVAPSALIQ